MLVEKEYCIDIQQSCEIKQKIEINFKNTAMNIRDIESSVLYYARCASVEMVYLWMNCWFKRRWELNP